MYLTPNKYPTNVFKPTGVHAHQPQQHALDAGRGLRAGQAHPLLRLHVGGRGAAPQGHSALAGGRIQGEEEADPRHRRLAAGGEGVNPPAAERLRLRRVLHNLRRLPVGQSAPQLQPRAYGGFPAEDRRRHHAGFTHILD
jgi:hypothetical protein